MKDGRNTKRVLEVHKGTTTIFVILVDRHAAPPLVWLIDCSFREATRPLSGAGSRWFEEGIGI